MKSIYKIFLMIFLFSEFSLGQIFVRLDGTYQMIKGHKLFMDSLSAGRFYLGDDGGTYGFLKFFSHQYSPLYTYETTLKGTAYGHSGRTLYLYSDRAYDTLYARGILDSLYSASNHKHWYNNDTTTMVRTFGGQTITGLKNFYNGVSVGQPATTQGFVRIYGTASVYGTELRANATGSNKTIDLPNASGTVLLNTNNLSDLSNAATARTNLGLGGGVNGTYTFYTGGVSGKVWKMTFVNGVCTSVELEP